jgi:acetoin utilization protein AcuB
VVESGKVVGIVTDRDIKRATPSLLSGVDQEEYDRILTTTAVSQVMTRSPFTVTPSMRLKDAVKILIDRKFGALPVVESGKLVGIVSAIDLLRAFHDQLED